MFEDENLVENLLPAVEQQLESSDTPYVKAAYDRLLNSGESEGETKMMIALCLADESNRMFIDKRNFDAKRYQELLANLPEIPE